jgi:hypothetical protein
MVGEPNKMTAAHPIAVEANHKTWKSIKKTRGTPAMWGEIIPLLTISEIILP